MIKIIEFDSIFLLLYKNFTHKMKKYIYFSLTVFGMLTSGCVGIKENSAESLLKNPETEKAIYSAILNDQEHLSKFINMMMVSENGKKLMIENPLLSKTLCMSGKMDSLISNDDQIRETMSDLVIKNMIADSVVCDKTCSKLIENEQVKRYIKQHTH